MSESVRQNPRDRLSAAIGHVLADARRQLEATYGPRLRRIVLFGSQARGDARPDSDVDVLVVLSGPLDVLAELRRLTPVKLDLLEQYDTYVAFQPFSEEAYEDRARPLMRNVHAEGVEL